MQLRTSIGALFFSCVGFFAALGPSAASAKPTIFWVSDPVDPNETVLVTGDGLEDIRTVEVTRLPDGISDHLSENNEAVSNVEPIQKNHESLKFIVPKQLDSGVYRFTLFGRTDNVSGILNKPSVYWLQGDSGNFSTVGGWVRVFGRNIGRSAKAFLMLNSTKRNAAPIILAPSKWSLWDALFSVSARIEPGDYQATLWNGQGGKSSEQALGTITIKAPPRDAGRLINVKDFKAVGDGLHDDTSAIAAALRALASRGGGTLLFPRGRYIASDELEIPTHVTMMGEARNLVSLNWLDQDSPPPALLDGVSDFAIKDLTIYASNYLSVISGGFTASKTLLADGTAHNIIIDNVTIRASAFRGHITPQQAMQRFNDDKSMSSLNGPVTIRLSGENIRITNSDVYGSGSAFLLLRPKGAYIGGNTFHNGHGWYSITGGDGVIFENNEVSGADAQSTGGGINTLASDVSSSRDILFSHNTFSLFHGWDREAMTSDGPGGYYYGPVAAIEANTLLLLGSITKADVPWSGAGLFIISGRGTGQYGRVAQFKSGKVTLDRPLAILPDQTSVVGILPMQQHYLMVGNAFSDTGGAIQFYGTSVEHLVVGNTSERTAGFSNRGLNYPQYQPSWYNQFLSNSINEGNTYDLGGNRVVPGGSVIGTYGDETATDSAPLTRGTIIRSNSIENNAEIEVKGGNIANKPGIVDVVVEGNELSNSQYGVVIDGGTRNVFVRDNSFYNVGTEISDHSSKTN